MHTYPMNLCSKINKAIYIHYQNLKTNREIQCESILAQAESGLFKGRDISYTFLQFLSCAWLTTVTEERLVGWTVDDER